MTYARDWWPLVSVQDRTDVLAHVQAGDTGPLRTSLADHILRAGGELIPVAGMEADRDSPWVLRDEDVDWVYAHGADAVVDLTADIDQPGPSN